MPIERGEDFIFPTVVTVGRNPLAATPDVLEEEIPSSQEDDDENDDPRMLMRTPDELKMISKIIEGNQESIEAEKKRNFLDEIFMAHFGALGIIIRIYYSCVRTHNWRNTVVFILLLPLIIPSTIMLSCTITSFLIFGRFLKIPIVGRAVSYVFDRTYMVGGAPHENGMLDLNRRTPNDSSSLRGKFLRGPLCRKHSKKAHERAYWGLRSGKSGRFDENDPFRPRLGHRSAHYAGGLGTRTDDPRLEGPRQYLPEHHLI